MSKLWGPGQYKCVIEDFRNDRKEASEMLHALIKNIYIQSRPVTSVDKVAGKRKSGQKIPFMINVELKLPNEMIEEREAPDNPKDDPGGSMSSGQNRLNGRAAGNRTRSLRTRSACTTGILRPVVCPLKRNLLFLSRTFGFPVFWKMEMRRRCLSCGTVSLSPAEYY